MPFGTQFSKLFMHFLNFLDTFFYEVLFGIWVDLIMDKDLITSDFVRRGNPKIRFYFDKR